MTICLHCQQYLVGFLSSSWMTAVRKQQNRLQTDNYGIYQRPAKSPWLDQTETMQIFRTFILQFPAVSSYISGSPGKLGSTYFIKQLPVFMYAAVKVVRPLPCAKINVRRKHFLVPSLTFAAWPVGKSRDSVGKTWVNFAIAVYVRLASSNLYPLTVTFGLLWFSRPNI